MKKHLIYFMIAGLLISSCTSDETSKEEETETTSTQITISDEDLKNNSIVTGNIPMIPLSSSVKATGEVEVPAVSKASIYAMTNGIIKQIFVLPGTKVSKGQRLATLADMEIIQLQEDYLKSKSKMEFLTPELQRKKELAASDAVSKKEYERVFSEYKMEESNLKGLAEKLKLIGISANHIEKYGIQSEISITSPISGNVSEVNVSLGEAVHNSKLLFEVIDDSYVHIVLQIPVTEIGKIKVGQECSYGLNTGMEELKGKVHLIGKKANVNNGTVEIHIDPEKSNAPLVVGSHVYAHVFTGTDTVPAILSSELIRKGDDFFIYAEKGKKWEQVKVETGISDEKYVEIRNKNLINRKVILKGNYFVINE